MKRIKVKVLQHNLDGTPLFLAKLTQRGHEINSINDIEMLFNGCKDKVPSANLLSLPHGTLKRMCYLTVAIEGLSTKAVSQLRTHARNLTFMSTSTQYSAFDGRTDNFVQQKADNLGWYYSVVDQMYKDLLEQGVDKDTASYILPQGLRKALIISGNFEAWQYMLKTRLCHRNTKEVQHICRLIVKEIKQIAPVWADLCWPDCKDSYCKEGKFCCGKQIEENEVID